MPKVMELGLVGCGNYGLNLARFIDQVEGLRLAAAADTDPAALQALEAQSPGADRYGDYKKMLEAAALDAVIIATPNDLHAEEALLAMDRGLAIYLEKPIACTIEDCRRVVEKQRRTGVPVMVGMQLRYGEVFRKAKQLLDEGVIGRPRMIWYREFRGPFKAGAGGWRLSNARSGGTIMEKSVHHFDLFNWYLGAEPESVYASAGADVLYGDSGMLDNAVVTVNYRGGARAALGLTLFSGGCDHDLDFYIAGSGGVIYILSDRLVLVSNADGGRTEIPVEQRFAGMGHGGTEFSALTAFYKMLAEGLAPMTGVREGLVSAGMALAAQMSAERRREVALREITGWD